jgi:hypothetical protein
MRFRARALARSNQAPDVADPDYLRKALAARLADAAAGAVVFAFEIQVKAGRDIVPDRDIENASHQWPKELPFQRVATLSIPLQNAEATGLRDRCDRLAFTPWHGLQDHRPLGGINRLRRAVYEASARLRGAESGR